MNCHKFGLPTAPTLLPAAPVRLPVAAKNVAPKAIAL
jgi:hypothetical protein